MRNLLACHRHLREIGTACNGACACPVDKEGRDILALAGAGECPEGRFAGGEAMTAPAPNPWANGRGAALWGFLHCATDADQAWLDRFAAMIPCGECRAHFTGLLLKVPPAFGAGWFEWTVEIHNAVNRRLGKPAMGLGEARERMTLRRRSGP
jgi:hypothetical protein